MNAGLILSFRKLNVSRNSSSVSPGNPTMTSMPKKTFKAPGPSILSLIYRIFASNAAVSYLLPISCNTVSLPDCNGIWKCGRNFVPDAIQSTVSSVSRLGSMDEILYLSMPSTLSRALRRSMKLSPVLFPKSPVFTPVRTISFTPDAAISSACTTMSATGMFLLLPLAYGTVQ